VNELLVQFVGGVQCLCVQRRQVALSERFDSRTDERDARQSVAAQVAAVKRRRAQQDVHQVAGGRPARHERPGGEALRRRRVGEATEDSVLGRGPRRGARAAVQDPALDARGAQRTCRTVWVAVGEVGVQRAELNVDVPRANVHDVLQKHSQLQEKSVPKIITNDKIMNLVFKTAISISVISNRNSFQVPFDKIASVYILFEKNILIL